MSQSPENSDHLGLSDMPLLDSPPEQLVVIPSSTIEENNLEETVGENYLEEKEDNQNSPSPCSSDLLDDVFLSDEDENNSETVAPEEIREEENEDATSTTIQSTKTTSPASTETDFSIQSASDYDARAEYKLLKKTLKLDSDDEEENIETEKSPKQALEEEDEAENEQEESSVTTCEEEASKKSENDPSQEESRNKKEASEYSSTKASKSRKETDQAKADKTDPNENEIEINKSPATPQDDGKASCEEDAEESLNKRRRLPSESDFHASKRFRSCRRRRRISRILKRFQKFSSSGDADTEESSSDSMLQPRRRNMNYRERSSKRAKLARVDASTLTESDSIEKFLNTCRTLLYKLPPEHVLLVKQIIERELTESCSKISHHSEDSSDSVVYLGEVTQIQAEVSRTAQAVVERDISKSDGSVQNETKVQKPETKSSQSKIKSVVEHHSPRPPLARRNCAQEVGYISRPEAQKELRISNEQKQPVNNRPEELASSLDEELVSSESSNVKMTSTYHEAQTSRSSSLISNIGECNLRLLISQLYIHLEEYRSQKNVAKSSQTLTFPKEQSQSTQDPEREQQVSISTQTIHISRGDQVSVGTQTDFIDSQSTSSDIEEVFRPPTPESPIPQQVSIEFEDEPRIFPQIPQFQESVIQIQASSARQQSVSEIISENPSMASFNDFLNIQHVMPQTQSQPVRETHPSVPYPEEYSNPPSYTSENEENVTIPTTTSRTWVSSFMEHTPSNSSMPSRRTEVIIECSHSSYAPFFVNPPVNFAQSQPSASFAETTARAQNVDTSQRYSSPPSSTSYFAETNEPQPSTSRHVPPESIRAQAEYVRQYYNNFQKYQYRMSTSQRSYIHCPHSYAHFTLNQHSTANHSDLYIDDTDFDQERYEFIEAFLNLQRNPFFDLVANARTIVSHLPPACIEQYLSRERLDLIRCVRNLCEYVIEKHRRSGNPD